MATPLMTLAAVAAVGVLYVLVPIAAAAYLRLRGPRLVTCPATHGTLEVELDATHGALTALGGRPALRIGNCARWEDPAHRNCGQGCLDGIDPVTAGKHGLLTRPLRATS